MTPFSTRRASMEMRAPILKKPTFSVFPDLWKWDWLEWCYHWHSWHLDTVNDNSTNGTKLMLPIKRFLDAHPSLKPTYTSQCVGIQVIHTDEEDASYWVVKCFQLIKGEFIFVEIQNDEKVKEVKSWDILPVCVSALWTPTVSTRLAHLISFVSCQDFHLGF